MKPTRRMALLALTLALVVMLSVAIITTLAGSYQVGELLFNGGFEQGFVAQEGCGMAGNGWGCFTTGGRGGYGFYDEGWDRAVASGNHAQLIEINTKDDFGDENRMAGIYQTVEVIPGETYTLSLQGMIRANDLDAGGDPWRYVMEVGFSHDGGDDWSQAVVQEIDVGPIQDRVDPSEYYSAKVQVTAQSHWLTVFISGRMKWGDWRREVDFDVDNVSLMGVVPSVPPVPEPFIVDKSGVEIHPLPEVMPERPSEPKPVPLPEPAPDASVVVSSRLICDGPNVLWNGSFEEGFEPNGVGAYWRPYNNNGAANYGYYDEGWPPVVAEGEHAQLFEINTYGMEATHPNRWSGIYQDVWLQPGVTYELSLQAMMREAADHSAEDPHRYEVYWGLEFGQAVVEPYVSPIAEVTYLDTLQGVPVSEITLRTAPGAYSSYSTQFTASSDFGWLYLLGLKKWATIEREVNFDIDNVQLRPCRSITVVEPLPEPYVEQPDIEPYEPQICTYLIKSGDTLAHIADLYGTTEAVLIEMNDLIDAGTIFVMQPLWVPCGDTDVGMYDHYEDSSDHSNDVGASGKDDGDAKASRGDDVDDSNSSRGRDSDSADIGKRNDDAESSRTREDDEVNSSRTREAEDASRSRDTSAESQAATSAATVHVVETGEYLGQIALRYGVTVKSIAIENSIENPSIIHPGQEVLIPTQ